MGKLIYSMLASADGFVADADGDFAALMPAADTHGFVNGLYARADICLFGRRLYEVMQAWERLDTTDEPAEVVEFAELWHQTRKVVYSSALPGVATANTTLVRTFDPAAVRVLKESAEHDLIIGGPTLAAAALTAGVVDEYHAFAAPITLGGGTSAWPAGERAGFELLDTRTFSDGTVYAGYRLR